MSESNKSNSSALLLAKYLPNEEQKRLILDLVENEQYSELSEVLNAVNFNEAILKELTETISGFVVKKIAQLVASSDENSNDDVNHTLNHLSDIVQKIPYLLGTLNEFIVDSLKSYIVENQYTLFDPSFQSEFVNRIVCTENETNTTKEDIKNIDILKLFQFSEKIFLNFEDHINMNLDQLLLVLQNCKVEDIAVMACKLTRWRIKAIMSCIDLNTDMDKFVWSLIPYMLSTSKNENQRNFVKKNALSVWLRLLMNIVSKENSNCNSENSSKLQTFKEFLQKDTYWGFIQAGLSHDLAEIRKISLSVLKLTLQTYQKLFSDIEFENSYISLSTSIDMSQWKKYTTLYEIVAVDTALNQFKDATQDFLDLFKKETMETMNPSWGLIILSTGMKSSMEGVRKYSLQLLFLIEDRSVFKYNKTELQNVFLPCAMIAANFNITNVPGTTSELECTYGDDFVSFIKDSIIQSTKNNSDYKQNHDFLDCYFDVLYESRSAYDPARIYLTLGIYRALKESDLRLNTAHIQKLSVAVFEAECEDKVFETMLQITSLRLLCFLDTNKDTLSSNFCVDWLLVLSSHIRKFGYEFFQYVVEDLREFSVVSFDKNDIKEFPKNSENVVFNALLYLFFGVSEFEITTEFLIELSKMSAFDNPLKNFQKQSIKNITSIYNDESQKVIENVSSLIKNSQDVNWNNFQLVQIEKNILNPTFIPSRFANSISLYEHVLQESVQYPSLKLSDLLSYYDVIAEYTKENKTLNSKNKDLWFKDYFKLVHIFMLSTGIDTLDDLQLILEVMKKSLRINGNYFASLEIVNIFKYLLDKFITFDHKYDAIVVNDINFILHEIWEIVSCERLVLNQRALHLVFIKTFFHKQVLHRCNSNNDIENGEDLVQNVINNGIQIIDASQTRRTLLPLLSSQLLEFVKIDQFLSNQTWLIELVKQAMLSLPSDSNIYKFKDLVATLFDIEYSSQLKYYFPQGLYFSIYGETEIMAKVSIVGAITGACKEFQQSLFENIFTTETNIFKANKRNDGREEMERLIKWQLATVALPNANLESLDSHVKTQLIPSLMVDETSPLCRYYNEWITAFSIVENHKVNSNNNKNLVHLLDLFCQEDIINSPVWLVSCVRVLYLSMQYLDDLALLKKFLTTLVSHCTCNKPLIRHFCNSLILSVWTQFKDILIENKESELCEILEKLYNYAKSTQVHGQYRSGDANVWDLVQDLTLTNIFGGLIYKISDHDVPIYIDSFCFNNKLGEMTLNSTIPIGVDDKNSWLKKRNSKLQHEAMMSSKKIVSLGSSNTNSTPLQTKSGAWNLVFDIDNKKSNDSIERSDLIVMASLVDKPPNLGGICRLCDVLGCGLLTVNDIKVKDHPQFKNVAVTADKWMPMEQVKIDEIVQFLTQKKLEGYTLVGLEQTDKSIKLDNNYKFPKKTVIVLGIEAFGIPGYVLEHLDLCLEIQQFGVIRSMNIQTATAVICYAYTIQHM